MVARITTVFLSPLFLILVIIYSSIRTLRISDYKLPEWINGYVTDFICMPLVLMICLVAVRVIKRNSEIEINKGLILVLCIEYAVIFEWILPKHSMIYTADPIDAVMYFLGGIFYYLVQPKFRMT